MDMISTSPTIGIAWLSMLCQTSSFQQTSRGSAEYVSGTGVSTPTAFEWMVSVCLCVCVWGDYDHGVTDVCRWWRTV